MTCVEALTTLGALGPLAFAAGVVVGYFRHHQDRLGRTPYDRRR